MSIIVPIGKCFSSHKDMEFRISNLESSRLEKEKILIVVLKDKVPMY